MTHQLPGEVVRVQKKIDAEIIKVARARRQQQGVQKRYEEHVELEKARRDRLVQQQEEKIDAAMLRIAELAFPNKEALTADHKRGILLLSGNEFGWAFNPSKTEVNDPEELIKFLEGRGLYDCIKVEKKPILNRLKERSDELASCPYVDFARRERFWVRPVHLEETISRLVENLEALLTERVEESDAA